MGHAIQQSMSDTSKDDVASNEHKIQKEMSFCPNSAHFNSACTPYYTIPVVIFQRNYI